MIQNLAIAFGVAGLGFLVAASIRNSAPGNTGIAIFAFVILVAIIAAITAKRGK